ncbi:MAG: peptidase M48 Ste24p, partial [Maritimibacter sp.]|nr:peptidase M48 Ste24p [Maritimibacter sp.]
MSGAGNTLSAWGDYLDGELARVRRVAVTVYPDWVEFAPAEGAPVVWRADELREVPDQAERSGILLARAGDPLARLAIADTAIAGALRANAPGLTRKPPVEHKGRIAGWALGAVASVALIIFVLVPLMANQLATLLPPEGERALG